MMGPDGALMGHCEVFVFSECCRWLRKVLSRGGTGSHFVLTGSLWLCVENGLWGEVGAGSRELTSAIQVAGGWTRVVVVGGSF